MQPRRLPELDAVRVGATLVILLYHFVIELHAAGALPLTPEAAQAISAVTEIAVAMFFLLSSTGLACRWRGGLDLRRYAVGRLAALYPMYWLGFLALFVYGEVLHGNNPDVPRWRVVFSLLGLDGYLLPFTATFYKIGEWFLGCLVLLYILFPLLRRLYAQPVARRVTTAVLALLWLAWPLLCPAAAAPGRTVLGRLAWFWLGFFVADALRNAAALCRLAGVGAGALVVALVLRAPVYYTAPLAGLALFALFCLPAARWDALSAPLLYGLRWGAARSYGLFLVHHVFLTIVLVPKLALRGLPWPVLLPLYLVGSVALALLLETCAKPLTGALRRLL